MLSLKRTIAATTAAVLAVGLVAAEPGRPGLGGPDPAPVAADGSMEVTIVKNTEKGYQVGYPKGWGVATGSGADFMMGPNDNSFRGFCVANGVPNPNLPDNAVMQTALAQPFPESWWDQTMFGQLPNKRYVKTGAMVVNGWPAQVAIVEGDVEGQPATISVLTTGKSKMEYAIICFVARDDYSKAETPISAVFKSFTITRE